jgi:hypothetical protein
MNIPKVGASGALRDRLRQPLGVPMKNLLLLAALGLVPMTVGCAKPAPPPAAKPFDAKLKATHAPEPHLMKKAPNKAKLTLIKEGNLEAVNGDPTQHGALTLFRGGSHTYLRVTNWKAAKQAGQRFFVSRPKVSTLRKNHQLFNDGPKTLKLNNAALGKGPLDFGAKATWFEMPAGFADAQSVAIYSKKEGKIFAAGNLHPRKPNKKGNKVKNRP